MSTETCPSRYITSTLNEAHCTREKGHIGMHIGAVPDGVAVQWATREQQNDPPEPPTVASPSGGSIADAPVQVEYGDLEAFIHVLPDHGRMVRVSWHDSSPELLAMYDTALIVDGKIEALVLHARDGRHVVRWTAIDVLSEYVSDNDESAQS